MIKCHRDTVMIKEAGYTYSSPNTTWINEGHKYNRGPVMTTELRNTIKDTRQAAYFIMRLGHHWDTFAQYPNDHGNKGTVKKAKMKNYE